jgi:hypothetical protein
LQPRAILQAMVVPWCLLFCFRWRNCAASDGEFLAD